MRSLRFAWAAVLGTVGLTTSLHAQPKTEPAGGPVSYFKDIRPIFQQNCQGCHQPAKAQGDYVMTDFAGLLKAGEAGKPGVVPGKPAESFLLDEIRVKDGKHEMPKNRDALTAQQVERIEQWIKEGAKDDTPASAKEKVTVDEDHPHQYLAPPVVTSLAFSPDGKLLAVTGYHEVLLHTADGSKIEGRLIGLSEQVRALAFSPDGKWLAAAAGSPGRFGEVQIWNVAMRKLKSSTPVSFDTLSGVSWSPDGKIVAFGCTDNTVRAIDADTGKQVLQMGTHSDWVLGTVFSQDGLHLASISRDMSMKLTEVPTQRFIDNVTSITPGALKGGLMALDRRPMKDKKMQKVPDDTPGAKPNVYDELLIAGSDGTPRLYKMHRETKRVIGDDANKVKQFEPMPGRTSCVRFNAAGDKFAAVSSLDGKGEVRVYEVESGKKVACERVTGAVYAVAWEPDGKAIASAGFDGKVWLHDATTGKLLKEFSAVPLTEKKASK
ncbi:WD40 domain-containing protein [Limnoglobus roseus]|uniref:NB-ARC domain protein n=1 Tax=Limnoglobus roseus TaxID=2598579 RepID=A0A5C1ACV8_9BACT|nr:c-type cytochrome domain-containing protein [Limnoglobus roseus]QEL15987.1 NB-ARC domain protein [Limnoglobus roseus]